MTFLLHDTANSCGKADRIYAQEKLSRLDRFLPGIDVVEFHHNTTRFEHRADIWLRGKGIVLRVSATSDHLRAAIDGAFERAASKLRRVHRRIVGKSKAR